MTEFSPTVEDLASFQTQPTKSGSGDDGFYENLLKLKNDQKQTLMRMHELYMQKQRLKIEMTQKEMPQSTQKPPLTPKSKQRPTNAKQTPENPNLADQRRVHVSFKPTSTTPRSLQKTNSIEKTVKITVPEPFSMSIRENLNQKPPTSGRKFKTAPRPKSSVTTEPVKVKKVTVELNEEIERRNLEKFRRHSFSEGQIYGTTNNLNERFFYYFDYFLNKFLLIFY